MDVFLKAELPRKPRLVVTEHHVDPTAPVGVELAFKDAVQFYDPGEEVTPEMFIEPAFVGLAQIGDID